MNIKCDKCKKVFDTSHEDYWKKGITFRGVDKHHNPPEEISRFLKEKWGGEFYNLCRDCHEKLHKQITLILKKYSNKQKNNSDYWLMMYSTPQKIKESKEEIYEFTKKWIKES